MIFAASDLLLEAEACDASRDGTPDSMPVLGPMDVSGTDDLRSRLLEPLAPGSASRTASRFSAGSIQNLPPPAEKSDEPQEGAGAGSGARQQGRGSLGRV